MSDNPAPVCKLCHVQYNSLERKPRCFMPCGHTFCEKCINGLLEKICPTCKNNYNQAIVDYGLIDIINKAHQLKSALKHACSNQQLKPEIIHLINEGTRDQQLIGLRALRKLLSKETDPPIQEVINAGLVNRLVEFLELPAAHAALTYESTWALTNITSGSSEQTQSVIKAGAIPKLVKLISSSNLDTSETAIWTLGNIGGDSAECRDLVINGGALERIAK